MKDLKLTIELLPKGAWNNDFSKTLPKKEWDTLREVCYQKANHRCQICGYETDDLDAHEVWEFDIKNKTQTLKDIIGICSKCHGVKHFKNSVRLGYADEAKAHFLKVNNCSEMEFANHLLQSVMDYEKLNSVFRWKMIANLDAFGGKGIEIKQISIPKIVSKYDNVDWDMLSFRETKQLFTLEKKNNNLIGVPKVTSIKINNYQGEIQVNSIVTNKIEWFLDGVKIKTKYNTAGPFKTIFSVKNLDGKNLQFILTNQNGRLISKDFVLENCD